MKTSTRKLTLSALFLALGLVLPLITGQIPQIGKMLLPRTVLVFVIGVRVIRVWHSFFLTYLVYGRSTISCRSSSER